MRRFNEIVLALIIAAIIWIYAKLNQTYSFVYKIPVEYNILAKGLALLEGEDSVIVEVSGRGINLLKFRLQKPILVYSLNGSSLEGVLYIDTSYLKPKQEVGITPLYPKVINYKLDRISKKVLPVTPIVKGNPKIGYFYLGWAVSENVIVEGPKTILENLDSIPTYPIDITGKTRDFDVYTKVFTEGLNIKVKPESVKVSILIDSLMTKEVPVVLTDTIITAKIQGPSRIVFPINSLRGKRLKDSIYVELPENVILMELPVHFKE
ncbi:MAG: YbbR-like domain-containing protein [candidate division WOR-3 bacterium]